MSLNTERDGAMLQTHAHTLDGHLLIKKKQMIKQMGRMLMIREYG